MNSNKQALKDGWFGLTVFLAIYILCSMAIGFALSLFPTKYASLQNIAYIVALGLISILLVYFSGWPKAALTIFPASKRKGIGHHFYEGYVMEAFAGFLLAAGLPGIGAMILYFLGSLHWTANAFLPGHLLSALLAMGWIAFYEELVFRGFIMERLWNAYNRWIALLASAIIFALFHAFNPGITPVAVLNIFTGGLLIGLTYMHNRNLWMPVFFHFGWNFIQGPILGFNVSGLEFPSLLHAELSGPSWITGGSFGFEGSLFQSLAAMTGMIILLFSRKQN